MLTTKIINKLKSVVSDKNVLLEVEERFVYSQDATNMQNVPCLADAVVFVENETQIQKILKLANENKIPVIARGAGTNLVGACIPLCGGIILNFSKMNKILEINPSNMTAKVQAGVVVGKLAEEASKYGLFYPPDPSNLKVSTIGGSIALNSGGAKTFKYGSTKDYVISLKIVTANGEIMNIGSNTAKNSTGYQMPQLFIGSEGTLGIIVEAVLKLIPKPESSKVMLAYFDSISKAACAVNKIIEEKLYPATLDIMDKTTLKTIDDFCPTGLKYNYEAALLIEVDGYECSLDWQQHKISSILQNLEVKDIVISNSQEEAEKIWTARRSAFGACAKLAPNVETGDIVVPREKIPQLVDEIREICNKNNLMVCILGHIGDGNIHPHIPLDLNNEDDVKNYEKAKDEIHKLALNLGGTLSGEHGIGCEKSKYMKFAEDSIALNYMKQIKNVFDPRNILNPKKIF